jgi:hypothetical protein
VLNANVRRYLVDTSVASASVDKSPRWLGINDLDFVVSARRATERLRFQLRGEAYNVLNHPNWSSPSTSPTAAAFGKVQSKSGNREIQAAPKRGPTARRMCWGLAGLARFRLRRR